MPAIRSIDEACDFILSWMEIDGNLGGPPLPSDQPYPDCVDSLNRRLGRIWSETDWSFCLHGLFNAQDWIIDPRQYAVTSDGVIPAVWENQHVWGYGFRPNTVGLLVCGDWRNEPRSNFDSVWRTVDASLEDALISVLLANFCLAFNTEGDGDLYASKPKDADILLWTHPAWNGFYNFNGFWTNKRKTLIHYGGMGFTARKKMKE